MENPKRVPMAGSIEVTFRCNLKCAHCYVAYDPSRKELSYQEICNIVDQIIQEGCLWLLITGGEPLLRRDFLDIYTYCKEKGLIISLFTNGTLITPNIADYLQEMPPFSVEITLYGITKDTYESVTNIPGSFERCIKGIHLLLKRKIPLKLKTMVMTLNKHELLDIQKYAKELDVEFRFDPILNPRLDGSKAPCQLRISPEEVVNLGLADKKRLKIMKESLERIGRASSSEYLYTCGAGRTSFNISPYGELTVCVMSRHPSYNIRQGSFQEGWYNFFPKILSQKIKDDYKCRNCEMRNFCAQCPGTAELETGSKEEPVEYFCQISHLLAKQLQMETFN